MKLYIYDRESKTPCIEIKDAEAYTADSVIGKDGTCYAPLASECELSAKADCSETLRADWREANPSDWARIEELEALVALLLYGGEGE